MPRKSSKLLPRYLKQIRARAVNTSWSLRSKLPNEDVLSLAEYLVQQRYGAKDKYTSTLPFDPSTIPIRKAHTLIAGVKANWLWYENAANRDIEKNTSLGTMNYLPQEVRDLVYQCVYESYISEHILAAEIPESNTRSPCQRDLELLGQGHIQITMCADFLGPEWGMYENEDSLDPYHALCDHQQNESRIELRNASPSLKTEFDNVLLHNNTLHFRCPNALSLLLTSIPNIQLTYLQHITIELFDICHGCACLGGDYGLWSEVLAQLPSTIKMIEFNIGPVMHNHCYHYEKGHDSAIEDLDRVVGLLEVLSKQVKRQVPGRRVQLAGNIYFTDEERGVLEGVLGEVEDMAVSECEEGEEGEDMGVVENEGGVSVETGESEIEIEIDSVGQEERDCEE